MNILLKQFDIHELLYENQNTIIYKAIRKSDNKKVIIKSYKSPEGKTAIRYEYNILKDKTISGISNVIDMVYNQDFAYLISEDKDAIVLDTYLNEHNLTQSEWLSMAKNAASALSSIHENKIIHRDIKPANMLIDPKTLKIWYIDFDIAVLNDKTHVMETDTVKGTLEYMAPEQTGRINAGIDFRTDLYSLGITLYRAATGVIPFESHSSMELIHAHIAVVPVRPSEIADVDDVISNIIMKLLNKTPQDRYQSAKSLEFDLSVCLENIIPGRDIPYFVLGERDLFMNLESGNVLYGKSNEMERLKQIFKKSISDKARLVIINGGESVGKTMFIDEFEKYVVSKNGYVLRGEFEQIEKNDPYYALRSAFEKFENSFRDSNSLLVSLKNKTKDLLGNNTQALANILPSMAPVLEAQKEPVSLGYIENQKRTEQVFKAFLQVMSQIPHPIVIVFDNVQWADYFSLKLFISALESGDISNCLIVWVNRTNSENSGYNLNLVKNDISKTKIDVNEMELKNLDYFVVKEIIDDLFSDTNNETAELAQAVLDATQGIVFKVGVFLKHLYDSKQIIFDNTDHVWKWDIKNIRSQSISVDMRDLFNRIRSSLTPSAISYINILACWGLEFNLEEVIDICKLHVNKEDLLETLQPALENKILLYSNKADVYRFESVMSHNFFYENIPEQDKEQTQFLIGYSLYEKYKSDPLALEKHCIKITDHLNRWSVSKAADGFLYLVVELNLLSGNKMMQATNTYLAIKFYNRGIAYLGEKPFEKNYSLAFELYLNYASCTYLLNDIEESEITYNILLENVKSEGDEYTIYKKRTEQYISGGEYLKALDVSCGYLKKNDAIPQIEDITDEIESAENDILSKNSEKKGLRYFLEVGMCQDEKIRRTGSMLAFTAEAGYRVRERFPDYYGYKTLNYAFENGMFPEFERAFSLLAVKHSRLGNYHRAKQIIELGIEYAEKYNVPQCSFWSIYGLCVSHWVNPIEKTPEIYKKAKRYSLIEGNDYYQSYADMIILNYHLHIGTNIKSVLIELESFIENAKRLQGSPFADLFSSVYKQYCKCMLGKTFGMNSFNDRHFSEIRFLKLNQDQELSLEIYHIYKLQALYIHGFYEKAAQTAEMFKKYLKNKRTSTHLSIVQYYYFYTLTLLKLRERGDASGNKTIEENLKILKEYSDTNTYNFMHKYVLLKAEYEKTKAVDLHTITQFSITDNLSNTSVFRLDMAIAESLSYDFWKSKNMADYYNFHLTKEIELYKQMCSNVKVWQLLSINDNISTKSHFTSITQTESISLSSETIGTLSNSKLDHETILNAISELTSETHLDILSYKLLNILMQNSCSNIGYIFINNSDYLSLMAFNNVGSITNDINPSMLPIKLEDLEERLTPNNLVRSVIEKKHVVVGNENENNFLFINDDYIKFNQPNSFVCIPIISNKNVLGAIYLENTKLSGMFPPSRIELLSVIILQASSLIQNVLYYTDLEEHSKNLEQRLKDYTNQLNSLISGIAHEINSPVGVCVTVMTHMQDSTSEIIKKFKASDLSESQLDEYLSTTENGIEIVVNNIMRAADLVQNFKKISVDQSTEIFEDLDLIPTIKNIINYLRPVIKKKIGKINYLCPESIIFNTSSGVLAQIFTNLMMNATIHAFENMDKENCLITIKITEQNDDIQIIFTDNGKGMTEDELSKLFQPFFTTKRTQGGSGLGAHIIMSHVTQTLGGSINCISTPGKGTSYIINLPRQR